MNMPGAARRASAGVFVAEDPQLGKQSAYPAVRAGCPSRSCLIC